MADLLAALNTGHAGGAATLHANSAADVPARFTALGALAGMDRACTNAQVASALHVVVQLRRGRAHRRVVAEIGLLESTDNDDLVTSPVWSAAGAGSAAGALAELVESRGIHCPRAWQ
jgi:pilus assembly protein CpaF